MLRRFLFILLLAGFAGCVQRTITIHTEPKGALVYLNDKEVGRTPVTVPFEWYGDYDVVLRKDGYESLKTHAKINQPWYEYIPIDIVSELFFPGTIHDDRVLDFDLKAMEPTNQKELAERALTIRAQAETEAPASQPAEPRLNKEAQK